MSGRIWAYIGAGLGGAVSIAANVAHSFIPPKEVANPAVWSPEAGAVIGSVVWPVFLFVAVEIFARVAWPDGLHWQLIRWVGLLPVAFLAALVSYRHLSGLLAFYGDETLVCILGPLAVDGLMIGATGAILATGHRAHTPEPLPVPADPDTSVPVPAPTSTTPVVPPVPVDAPPPAVDTPTVNPAPALPVAEESARTPEPYSSDVVPTPDVIAARVTKPTSISPNRSSATSRPAAPAPRPRPSKPATTPAAPLPGPAADTSVTEPDPVQLKLPTVAPELLVRADQIARQYRAENNGEQIRVGQLAARLRVNSDQAADALEHLAMAPILSVNGRDVSTANR